MFELHPANAKSQWRWAVVWDTPRGQNISYAKARRFARDMRHSLMRQGIAAHIEKVA